MFQFIVFILKLMFRKRTFMDVNNRTKFILNFKFLVFCYRSVPFLNQITENSNAKNTTDELLQGEVTHGNHLLTVSRQKCKGILHFFSFFFFFVVAGRKFHKIGYFFLFIPSSLFLFIPCFTTPPPKKKHTKP